MNTCLYFMMIEKKGRPNGATLCLPLIFSTINYRSYRATY